MGKTVKIVKIQNGHHMRFKIFEKKKKRFHLIWH